MRHTIQHLGHELLPILFTVSAFGSTLLFYLGNYYEGRPPAEIIIPVIVATAISIEFATFTILQDLQDAISLRQGGAIIRASIFAAIVLAASIFMMANASATIWAPRDTLLGIAPRSWSWIMACFFFGIQLTLKLQPEQGKDRGQLIKLAAHVEEWKPGATLEEKAQIAARMLDAISIPPLRQLPPITETRREPDNTITDGIPTPAEEVRAGRSFWHKTQKRGGAAGRGEVQARSLSAAQLSGGAVAEEASEGN